MKQVRKTKQLNTHKLVTKAFAVCSVLMILLPVHTQVVAQDELSDTRESKKTGVCHLTHKGKFKLRKLPKSAVLGHLMHHEADILPVDGQCVAEVTYEIGDTGPGGGIVFYVDDDSRSGLEAAPEDQVAAQWCSAAGINTDIPGVDNLGVASDEDTNSGQINTPLIVDFCGASSAAGVAQLYVWPNGQTDGFLPNKEELNLLFLQKDKVGGFVFPQGNFYWSSSEHNNRIAWRQSFITGGSGLDDKGDASPNGVRAVRVFNY